MRQAALPKSPATHPPAPRAAWKSQFHRVRGFAFEARSEPKFFRCKPEQALFRTAKQTFAGPIDQPQL